MIKANEIDTKEFLSEFKTLLSDLKTILKNDNSTHFDLYKKSNEFIGCFNLLKHEIRETAQYSKDQDDYLNLGL